jgi:hypothetical protein
MTTNKVEYRPPFADPDFAREAGKKGGIASAKARKRPGLDKDKLGPLETHEDAKRWLRLIGEAVVTLALDKGDAQAGIRAVEAWLKAEADRVELVVLDDLKADVKRLQDDLKTPTLKLEGTA